MTGISKDLFLAILSMDAYNRGSTTDISDGCADDEVHAERDCIDPEERRWIDGRRQHREITQRPRDSRTGSSQLRRHGRFVVLAGHRRSKNGVASRAYVPAIHVLDLR